MESANSAVLPVPWLQIASTGEQIVCRRLPQMLDARMKKRTLSGLSIWS